MNLGEETDICVERGSNRDLGDEIGAQWRGDEEHEVQEEGASAVMIEGAECELLVKRDKGQSKVEYVKACM